jgi:hypothetical protein
MLISRGAVASVERYSPAAAVAPPERTKAGMLAQQVCLELQALTGNAGASVLLDILLKRLRVSFRELEVALAIGVERGWIERKGDTVALNDEGRQATLVPWPPSEPPRPSQARLR